MVKNDEIEVFITGTTAEGNGVGRYGGKAVFVPLAAEGDKLIVRIVKVMKNYCYGMITRILKPSPYRVETDCEVFGKCGGCVYRHISYETECAVKYNRVAEAIKRIGNIDVDPEPIIPAVNSCRYRNKAQYPVGQAPDGTPVIGFYAPRSHRIIESSGCNLQPAIFDKVVEEVRNWIIKSSVSIYNEETCKGLIRHIYIRKATKTEEAMVALVINGDSIPEQDLLLESLKNSVGEQLKSVQININKKKTNVILGDKCVTIFGSDYITDTLCGLKVRISPLSFYQVNRDMAEILYSKAYEYAQPEGKTILDLYCGAGTIGLSMAAHAKQIIGVENVEQAVKDAIANAEINGIKNAKFITSDAAMAAEMLWKEGIRPDVVVVDPPRKGCTPELLETVAQRFTPDKIVYVSCDPATLARDLKLLESQGYQTKTISPVDLFPKTTHVECVVLMSRAEK